MKYLTYLLILTTLFSCSLIRIEKRTFNNGFYIHKSKVFQKDISNKNIDKKEIDVLSNEDDYSENMESQMDLSLNENRNDDNSNQIINTIENNEDKIQNQKIKNLLMITSYEKMSKNKITNTNLSEIQEKINSFIKEKKEVKISKSSIFVKVLLFFFVFLILPIPLLFVSFFNYIPLAEELLYIYIIMVIIESFLFSILLQKMLLLILYKRKGKKFKESISEIPVKKLKRLKFLLVLISFLIISAMLVLNSYIIEDIIMF